MRLCSRRSVSFLKRAKCCSRIFSIVLRRNLPSKAKQSLRLAHELRPDADVAAATPGATLTEDELVDRFKHEFGAEELPPEPQEES